MPPACIGCRESLAFGMAIRHWTGGQALPVRNVVWCTGFDNQPSWVALPVFGTDGEPRRFRSLAADEPGLYFLGREFMYALSSVMIQGAGRDTQDIIATHRYEQPDGVGRFAGKGDRRCPRPAGGLLTAAAGDAASIGRPRHRSITRRLASSSSEAYSTEP